MASELIRRICAKCQAVCKHKCQKCEGIYYCSIECQKADWPRHKKYCGEQASQVGIDLSALFAELRMTDRYRLLMETGKCQAGLLILKMNGDAMEIYGLPQGNPITELGRKMWQIGKKDDCITIAVMNSKDLMIPPFYRWSLTENLVVKELVMDGN